MSELPAPACIKVLETPLHNSLCAPAAKLIFVPGGQPVGCPDGYQEVTGDPAFADVVLLHKYDRICHRQTTGSPPESAERRLHQPELRRFPRQFLCPATKLPVGNYSAMRDKTPPAKPTFKIRNTSRRHGIRDGGDRPRRPHQLCRIIADDPHGLGGVELMEWVENPDGGVNGAPYVPDVPALARRSGPVLLRYAGDELRQPAASSCPYLPNDPAKRHFFARVYDRAGNSSLQYGDIVPEKTVFQTTIDSFTVTPSSVPLPGGPVTISWAVRGATAASIDMGVGAIPVVDNIVHASTGSRVVNVAANTTFTLSATHPTRNPKIATVSVALGADTTAPTVSLSASPAAVVAPGSTLLAATASDAVGVTKVEFYRGATLLGTDTTPPYEQAAGFTPADIGGVAFTAKAYDAADNVTTSAVLSVSVGADVTAPSVSLAASPSTVLVPGSTTLQATATDAIGVTKVEFHRSGVLIATDTTAPYQLTLDFTAADVGSASFTARAFDAQGNNATSAAAIVTVSTPTSGDTYAGPTGVDVGNTTCAQATPCRSIAKAAGVRRPTGRSGCRTARIRRRRSRR